MLNVLEYLSDQNLADYHADMKRLTHTNVTDPVEIARLRAAAYAMSVERVEIAHPSPTVQPWSLPGTRRPM